ncbi:hypothetical protein [Scytonema hofmannii]|nr:hypothetical protein [Scytonema hofmannii]
MTSDQCGSLILVENRQKLLLDTIASIWEISCGINNIERISEVKN